MPCKFVKGEGFTAFQCTPNEYQTFGVVEYPNNKPYEDGECCHDRRFELKGVFTCQDCGATYHEESLSWY